MSPPVVSSSSVLPLPWASPPAAPLISLRAASPCRNCPPCDPPDHRPVRQETRRPPNVNGVSFPEKMKRATNTSSFCRYFQQWEIAESSSPMGKLVFPRSPQPSGVAERWVISGSTAEARSGPNRFVPRRTNEANPTILGAGPAPGRWSGQSFDAVQTDNFLDSLGLRLPAPAPPRAAPPWLPNVITETAGVPPRNYCPPRPAAPVPRRRTGTT